VVSIINLSQNLLIEQIKSKAKKTQGWKNLESLIFPPMCGICGKLNENYLCGRCYKRLEKEIDFNIENYITEAGFRRKHFDEHIYFFKYQGLIREQIIDFKFNDEAYKYRAISNFILKKFISNDSKIFQTFNEYDLILPVPVSKKRFKERGYNQAELIAKPIAKFLEKPIETKCLYKSKNIIAQSTLNKEQREENIKDVYALKNKKILSNKKVLLVDDIYTTGSTANECCRVLAEANTSKIGVMTIAKD